MFNRWPLAGRSPSATGDSNILPLYIKYKGCDRVRRHHKVRGKSIQINCGQFSFFFPRLPFLKMSFSDLCSFKKPGFALPFAHLSPSPRAFGRQTPCSFHPPPKGSGCYKKNICYRVPFLFWKISLLVLFKIYNFLLVSGWLSGGNVVVWVCIIVWGLHIFFFVAVR